MKGSVLYDTGYPIYVGEQIKNARKSIYVTMFFMSYDPKKKKSAVNQLVDSLAKAKKRGVSVNVILDRDKEGDVYLSRIINKEAFTFLMRQGVNVYFDSVNILTHSKVIVVDEAQVIIGSHNWTLDSFYKYNETSLVLNSPELADYYITQFKSRI